MFSKPRLQRTEAFWPIYNTLEGRRFSVWFYFEALQNFSHTQKQFAIILQSVLGQSDPAVARNHLLWVCPDVEHDHPNVLPFTTREEPDCDSLLSLNWPTGSGGFGRRQRRASGCGSGCRASCSLAQDGGNRRRAILFESEIDAHVRTVPSSRTGNVSMSQESIDSIIMVVRNASQCQVTSEILWNSNKK